MKKIRTSALIFSLFIMILLSATILTGCKNQAPSKKQIMNDIQENVLNKKFKFEMTLKNYDVELSQTKDETYTATINAIGKSTYADWIICVDVEYKKYDQGWLLEKCTCTDYTYEQTRYPSKNEVAELISSQGLQDMEQIDISYENEAIVYRGKATSDWSKHASGSAVTVVTWEYSPYYDSWKYYNIEGEKGSFQLTKALEGKWKLWNEDGYIIIENVTDSGFDVTYYNHHFHFSLENGIIFADNSLSLSLSDENPSDYRRAEFTIWLDKTPSASPYNGKLSDITFILRIEKSATSFIASFVTELSSNISN